MNLTSNTRKKDYNNIPIHRSTGLTLIFFLFIAFVFLLNNSMAEAQKIYWMDAGTGKIQRADLDGKNVEEVITGVSSPIGIAIDGDRQQMYWTEMGKIQRSELDGSHVETIRTVPAINDIDVDASRGKIYWTIVHSGRIQRANLDGSSLEDFARTVTPYSIAIGEFDVYWTSAGMGKVERKDVDGGLIIDAVDGEGLVTHGLAVDSIGGKIYWTDEASHKIQRANLDGTQIEDIVTTGLQQPRDIVVNGILEKIFWADFGTGKIQRADLDGSHVEDIVIGLSAPVDIALDISPASSISYSTPLLDFGDVIAGEPISITFSVGNKGTMPLIVSGITSTLGNVLTISETDFTVAPREEQHVTLTLNSSSIGAITGTLIVTGNALNSPKEISITGNVRGAQVDTDTDIIDFGAVRVGKSKIIPVAIRNTGNADLEVTSITSTLGGVLDISGFPFTVAPSLAHFVTLVLTPTNVGSITGTLTISSNAVLSTLRVPITVNAIDPQPLFNLTMPPGLSLIHLPISATTVNDQPMELKTIGDLYDVLTPDNVQFIITRDSASDIWRSYLGDISKASQSDRTIAEDLGIILVMANEVTMRLKGDPWGTEGRSAIHLNAGTNLVGVPLMDGRLRRVSDLLDLEGLRDKTSTIIVSDQGEFKVVAQAGDDGDIPITGGQAFMVIARETTVAQITGEGWDNVSFGVSSAPPRRITGHSVGTSTPVLAVSGNIVNDMERLAKNGLHVRVKNLSTDAIINAPVDPSGDYNLTFFHPFSVQVAQAGDILEIRVQSPGTFSLFQTLHYTISIDDIRASQIRLPDLVANRIPQKTRLLENYPNPFNPETWIPYELAKQEDVRISIYSVDGHRIRTLEVGTQSGGEYTTTYLW